MRVISLFVSLVLSAALYAEHERSDHNLLWASYFPGKTNFERYKNRAMLHQPAIDAALSAPFSSPKNALVFALYHDYFESNASEPVFAAYEYAAYNGGNIKYRRGYLAFADFLIRSRNYSYVLDNLQPDTCNQFESQCAYYRVVSGLLRDGYCDEKWYETALLFSTKRSLLKSKCRGRIRAFGENISPIEQSNNYGQSVSHTSY